MTIAHTVASAMNYLITECDKVHVNANLSLSNIMFTENWECKLADQFFRKWKHDLHLEVYPSDEVSLIKEYGYMLWQLITEQDAMALKRKPDQPLSFPSYCPSKLKDLILSCISPQNSHPKFASFIDPKVWDDIFLEAIGIGKRVCNEIWDRIGEPASASVPWSKFFRGFCSHFNINYDTKTETTLESKYLAIMMGCAGSNATVTKDGFQRIFSCIGPFIDGSEILDQVTALMETSWFLGALGAPEAERLLQPLGDRSFLVRFSPNSGEFSITFKENNKIYHTRVLNEARFNLHNYVQMLISKKGFKHSPPSPFKVTDSAGHLHEWKFIR